jgi:cytochrome c oxidase assembly protein subunit 15
MSHAALIRAFASVALGLCLVVVVLGAYVRLSAAGLGCPDWPGCYGHLTPASVAASDAVARPFEPGKAWREMVHRYAAGTVGVLILVLTAMAVVWRRERAVSVPFMLSLLAILVAQAALGMLTVTWQLKPLIVTAHLLFGFTTLSLLWWLVLTLRWRARGPPILPTRTLNGTRGLALLALVVLVLQIALGGWTSSNYAATACPDFPTCQGSWWPQADFRAAYVLWRGLGVNYEGGVLDNAARVAIQVTHRCGAVIASLLLLLAALAALRERAERTRQAAFCLLLLLALQLVIGASMVLRGFPLWLATAHNAGAALLLLAVVALNRSLRPA